MGTRGLFGFCYKNKYYLVYNHLDSYPSWLGKNLVAEIISAIKNNTFDEWLPKLLSLKIIDQSNPVEPTSDDISKLTSTTNLGVSTQSQNDWYCLLRQCQGSYLSVLNSGYLLQNSDKAGCDLFIEFCYVVNFDDKTFDYYAQSDTKTSVPFTDLTIDLFRIKKE